MTKKYIAIFSIAILFAAGSVLADQQEWTVGNLHYKRVGGGLEVTQINPPAQTQPENKNTQQCVSQCEQSCNSAQSNGSQNKGQAQPAQQPTQQTFDIASVAPISDINVNITSTTSPSDASSILPANVTATMSDSSTQSIAVTWDGGTPTYDSSTAGTYVFSGTLTLPNNITNTNNLTASVNVVVADQSNSLEQTTSPSTSEVIIQDVASSLLNSMGSFINNLFHH